MVILTFFLKYLWQGNETLVTKTTVTVPVNGGPVEAVSTIEAVPYWTRSRRKTGKIFTDTSRSLWRNRALFFVLYVVDLIQASITFPKLS